ncbi:MAG: ornithine decarboxylase/arginine decarboxylase [Gammaproteobacteria bacterium]|nr:ornithine decarboxylase/arginine decarboxylase [Gammaproteobacteria bacterium]
MNGFLTDTRIKELAAQHGTPLLVLDCNVLKRQVEQLRKALPGVDFFYAVKAFPHPDIINTMDQCGVGFDLASSGEIELVRQFYINPRNTIHTHPIKKNRDIRDSLRFGCTTFVVDNGEEMKKFYPYQNRVGLLLRVSFPNPDAIVDLSRKFGCSPDEAIELLEMAKQMGMHVKGLSFHVGSQSRNSNMHVTAIRRCREILNDYNRHAEIPMSMLDIGGGFPVNYCDTMPDIDTFCAPITEALRDLGEDLHIIAEPGRFLVAPAAISITAVTGKAARGGRNWYYLDDGVYGAYSGQIFDHARYPIRCLKAGPASPSVLAGPTCDSIDIISEEIQLPELEIGDLVIGEMMGAYTVSTATDFNSLSRCEIIVLNKPEAADKIPHIA